MRKNLTGQQIDRYQVVRHLASGGMADVFLAQDIDLERPVALKIMDASLATDQRYVERFQREARTVARLNHPNIVQIYATGLTPDGHPYLAMQYVAGRSLAERLAALVQQGRIMATSQVLDIARPIADALSVAHASGIVHRDLKPANILLHEDGKPVLVDLGIAATRGDARLTQTGAIIGTPHYMSPEQIMGEMLDGRSDLYSLGIILYEMLVGHVPFDAPESVAILYMQVHEAPRPLADLRPDLTPQLVQVVANCLQKSPVDRYASGAELGRALDLAYAAESGLGGETVVLETSSIHQPQPAGPLAASSTQGGTGRSKWLLALIPLLLFAGLFLAWRTNLLPGTALGAANPNLPDPTATATEVVEVAANTPAPTSEDLPPTDAPPPTDVPPPTDPPLPSATPEPTAVPPTPTPALQPLPGSGVVRVTSDGANEYELNLSPDQGTGVFFSDRDGTWQVYTADALGGTWRQLTFSPGESQHPHFSPDGDSIAFASDRSGDWEIYTMRSDGGDVQQLTFHDDTDTYPVFSPDGEWITFMSRKGNAWGIYRMRPDGSDTRAILDTPADETFAMMFPNGQQVVFQSNAGGTHGIYIASVDGQEVKPLFDSDGRDANPVVSPNGRWIAFESDQTGDYEIYVMRPDGSELRNLTSEPGRRDQLPFFSPDGRWILYQSSAGQSYDLFRLAFDSKE